MPDPLPTLPQLVREAARYWPDRIALVFDPSGERLTFSELERTVLARAQVLRATMNVTKGTRVGVMLPNSPDWPLSWLALTSLGAVVVPVNVRLGPEDRRSLLKDARVSAVLCERADMESVASSVPVGAVVIAIDEVRGFDRGTWDELLPRVHLEDPANLQFTSGSTGTPRGCSVSHGYWAHIARTMASHGPRLDGDDVLLTAQPFSYMDPFWNVAVALTVGARLVVVDGFHPSTFWTTVREHETTYFYCLGVMPAMLLTTPVDPSEREHAVRYISCSAIPHGRRAELEQRFGAPWYELYGSTETGVDIMVEQEDHARCRDEQTLGTVMPSREIRVLEASTRRAVERGSPGVLHVRGAYLSDGYPDSPSAHHEAFAGSWYCTGDVVTQSHDGAIAFLGRHKDIIRRSGENISSMQVEGVLEQHDSVRIAACLPAADDVRGEEIIAFIVPTVDHDDNDLWIATVITHVEASLSSYKVPRYWAPRPELPLTVSSKVAKGELRRRAPGSVYDRSVRMWIDTVSVVGVTGMETE